MAGPKLPPLPAPHTRIGVGGVLLRQGRVLVNRASYRERFTIPSGYVERGETLEAALVREFLEETGVRPRVGALLLARHKVVHELESDLYLAFALDHLEGEPVARPPEIAEVREVTVSEAEAADWISPLSRTAIRIAAQRAGLWPRSPWTGGAAPGLGTEAYHPSDVTPIDGLAEPRR